MYLLIEENEGRVEGEIKKLMEAMKIQAINNKLTPRRTGGILLAVNSLSAYDKHYGCLYRTMKVY
jgi:hypothetical protein